MRFPANIPNLSRLKPRLRLYSQAEAVFKGNAAARRPQVGRRVTAINYKLSPDRSPSLTNSQPCSKIRPAIGIEQRY
jgi:hypothetical protein